MIPGLILGVTLALALAGRGLARRSGWRSPGLAAAITVGIGVGSGLVTTACLAAPFSPWDSVRLAPAMALLRGVNPYAGADSGAVLSTMYGPVAMVAYIPAALAGDPATSATLGRLLAFAFCFLPLAACCRPFEKGAGRGWRFGVLVSSTLAMLLMPSLQYSTTFLHADAPALGLTGLSCLLALRKNGRSFAAALSCALAIWTKQTLVTLPIALVIWAWIEGGPRRAVRTGSMLVATVAASCVVVALLFDRDSIYLNLVQIPGGVPWRGHAPWNLGSTGLELLFHAAPLLFAGLLVTQVQPKGVEEAARSRCHLFALTATLLVPMAVLGRVKQAGDVNSFSPALYPLLLAVASRASAVVLPELSRVRLVLAATLAGLSTLGIVRLHDEIRLLAIERPRDAEVSYLTEHPGSVYFPWNPAVHVALGGRPTHHLFSAWERGVAGYPVDESHLRSAIPPGCEYVAFPLKRLGPVMGFGSCVQMLRRDGLLAEPETPIRLAGLPDYECFKLARTR